MRAAPGGGAFAWPRARRAVGQRAPPSDDGGLDDYGSLDEGVCASRSRRAGAGVDDQTWGRGVAPAIGAAGSHDALHPFSLASAAAARATART